MYVELEKGIERANGVGEIAVWSSWLPHPHSNIDQGREVQWDPLLRGLLVASGGNPIPSGLWNQPVKKYVGG